MKKRIALVLPGGAWGYAHIGVIEELESRGYEIACIAGCSMGVVVGVDLPLPANWTCTGLDSKPGLPRCAAPGGCQLPAWSVCGENHLHGYTA